MEGDKGKTILTSSPKVMKTEWKNKKMAYRYTGFRHIKYEIRTLFDKLGLIKSRNLYKGIDISNIEQELFKKIHG